MSGYYGRSGTVECANMPRPLTRLSDYTGMGLAMEATRRRSLGPRPGLFTGERSSNWSGDNASYNAVHRRITARRGRAAEHTCRHCGGAAKHWAYDHTDPDERHDTDCGPYSLDVDRYLPLCVACHRIFDDAPIGHRGKTRSEPRPCSVDGCERTVRARGWCNGHYKRWRKKGHLGGPELKIVQPGRLCGHTGCDRPYLASGLCSLHYNHRRRHAELV